MKHDNKEIIGTGMGCINKAYIIKEIEDCKNIIVVDPENEYKMLATLINGGILTKNLNNSVVSSKPCAGTKFHAKKEGMKL